MTQKRIYNWYCYLPDGFLLLSIIISLYELWANITEMKKDIDLLSWHYSAAWPGLFILLPQKELKHLHLYNLTGLQKPRNIADQFKIGYFWVEKIKFCLICLLISEAFWFQKVFRKQKQPNKHYNHKIIWENSYNLLVSPSIWIYG